MTPDDRLKYVAAKVAAMLHRLRGDRAQGRTGILMYHSVSPCVPGLPERPYNVTPDVFRKQLVGLLRSGHRFVKLSEVLAAHRDGVLLPRTVVLTFDDVYESIYRHAFPIMKELQVPGAAFLSTSFVGSQDPFPFDDWARIHQAHVPPQEYRPLSWDQCHEMHESGCFEFGVHTHSHLDFRGKADAFRKDLVQSIEIIRQQFQLPSVPFAFPFGATAQGYAGGELQLAAKAAGTSCALTTDGELIDPTTDDPYAWGRLAVFEWDTSATLAAKLANWYSLARRANELQVYWRRQAAAATAGIRRFFHLPVRLFSRGGTSQ